MIAPFSTEIIDALAALERAATALAEIGTEAHPKGILAAYDERGGAVGNIAATFIAAQQEARQMIAEWERHNPDWPLSETEKSAVRTAIRSATTRGNNV